MSDDATLDALRLADSFLPVGGYASSYGIEQFVQSGRVSDADDLRALLSTQLLELLARADLVALRTAHSAARSDDVDAACDADRRLTAVTTAAEFRRSAESAGNRLLELEGDLVMDEGQEDAGGVLDAYAARADDGRAPGNYPVALGVVTALRGVGERDACLVCCHGFATGLLGAAQRLMPLGHTDAQRTLRALQPAIHRAVGESEERSIERMAPFAPLADVVSAEHERAERRLFVS